MPFRYHAIATDSNYHAIAIEVMQDDQPMPSVGVTVSLAIKDRDTRQVILPENTVVPPSKIVGRWEHWFTPEQVALITAHALWLVEWKIQIGKYTWRLEQPAELPVRKKI